MSHRPVLVLGRHARTETDGEASPGTRFLFSSLEDALSRHFTLLPVPRSFYQADRREALRVAIDLVQRADACLLGLPPGPSDLDPFFVVRERLQKAIPFVYMPLGEFPRGAWFYRHLHRLLGPRDLLAFSSHADREIHRALVASFPGRVAVIPFGIRTDHFRPRPRSRQTTRRRLGLNDDDVVFVYHGRITAEKNVHAVLALGRRLVRKHANMRLWIVGALPASAPLRRLLRDLLRDDPVLAARTTLWGEVLPQALPRLLTAADIAISLTLNGDENFGYGVVEAMACGLPVIGTGWGGLKDTIEHGVTGFQVPTYLTPSGVALDQLSAWHSAVELLVARDRRLRMGAAARDRAVRRFGLGRFAGTLSNQIARLIDSGEVDSCAHVPTAHGWTELGERLMQGFITHEPTNTARALALPVPPGPTLFRDHPVMRDVLRPYASPQRPAPGAEAVILATEFLHLGRAGTRSLDPRYHFCPRDLTAADRRIVNHLRRHFHATLASLEHDLAGSLDPVAIRDAVRALRGAGITLAVSRPDQASQ